MKENNAPQTIRLTDYKAPYYLVDTTDLRFELFEDHALVIADIKFYANPQVPDAVGKPLELVGAELELISLSIDGKILNSSEFSVDAEQLTIPVVPAKFVLQVQTRIKPQANTSLEGLYKSKGMFCTQCEAEGFRKITYYLDRPDVMAKFTTTVVAEQSRYPVLLSNGNPIASGAGDDGRHWVTWEDPFKKPCYLFALVAGDLSVLEDAYITCSGRSVKLQIFVEPQDLDKLDHAMDSLKRSMKWDEEVYGREYDLDIYMVVAVSHFNMGAMENKGLNIFNTSCVLAKAGTTTDAGFQRVEGVIAHEYFHNWSGNRVTCRDWFQLSLKEGFTVFRDQEFSADMGSRTVKRIEDVSMLRTVQFAEDAGPMAHPVRPEAYIEINNFYTVTIYEKGAEVVRMLCNLVGRDGFRKATDLYFERHDGQAVTCDDFVKAVEDANEIDLAQFKLWYSQAGTPEVSVATEYDDKAKVFRLTLSQRIPDTPGQKNKKPMHIPVAVGLVGADGADLPLQLLGRKIEAAHGVTQVITTEVLALTEATQTFEFGDVEEKPIASVLRGFSAPVKLIQTLPEAELAFLMANDSDGFNRWSAGQELTVKVIQQWISELKTQGEGTSLSTLSEGVVAAFRQLLSDSGLDRAMVSKMLELPTENYLAELAVPVNPGFIHRARQHLKVSLAQALEDQLLQVYDSIPLAESYVFDSESMADRALKNTCLSYLVALEKPAYIELGLAQYHAAKNMTDQLAAFRSIVHSENSAKDTLIASFYEQWKEESLVVDQWFMAQASAPGFDTLERIEKLLNHEAFELTNPNKVRSVVSAFANGNPANFHRADGEGYRFLADRIIELNKLNPQIASRLSGALSRWHKLVPELGDKAKVQLRRIMEEKLSPDVYEIISKSLKDD